VFIHTLRYTKICQTSAPLKCRHLIKSRKFTCLVPFFDTKDEAPRHPRPTSDSNSLVKIMATLSLLHGKTRVVATISTTLHACLRSTLPSALLSALHNTLHAGSCRHCSWPLSGHLFSLCPSDPSCLMFGPACTAVASPCSRKLQELLVQTADMVARMDVVLAALPPFLNPPLLLPLPPPLSPPFEPPLPLHVALCRSS
jgi:hypothetical protein